jgi:hypothetical protein
MEMIGIMAVATLIGVLAITNQIISISNRDLGHIKMVGMQGNKTQYMIMIIIYSTIP